MDKGTKMKVRVNYLGLVKTYTKKSQDDIELNQDAKLVDLLEKLSNSFGKPFNPEIYDPAKRDVKAMFTVMVNGIIMGQLSGVETPLRDGDSIIIMPLMTGG
jgi:molybdopterin converting factor small subunit